MKKMVIRCSSSRTSLSLGTTAAAVLARQVPEGGTGRPAAAAHGPEHRGSSDKTRSDTTDAFVFPARTSHRSPDRAEQTNELGGQGCRGQPLLQSGRPAPIRSRGAGARQPIEPAGAAPGGAPPARPRSLRPGAAAPPRLARPRPPPLTQLAAGLLQLLDLVLQEQHGHPEDQHRQQLQLGRQHNPEQPHEQQQQRRLPGITT